MTPFTYVEVGSVKEALEAFHGGGDGRSKWIAGGTNLVDLMKENVERPMRLIDLNALDLHGIEPAADGGLMLGALARNAATAYNDTVRRRYPLLNAALLAGASPQIRNMATNGATCCNAPAASISTTWARHATSASRARVVPPSAA